MKWCIIGVLAVLSYPLTESKDNGTSDDSYMTVSVSSSDDVSEDSLVDSSGINRVPVSTREDDSDQSIRDLREGKKVVLNTLKSKDELSLTSESSISSSKASSEYISVEGEPADQGGEEDEDDSDESSEISREEDSISEEVPKDQYTMVRKMRRLGYIRSDVVAKTLLNVDILYYALTYFNHPANLGDGWLTPMMEWYCYSLEVLKDHLKPGNRVLLTELGNGYLPVCMAVMVNSTGLVVGIEDFRADIYEAHKRIKENRPKLLTENRLRLIQHNSSVGYPQLGPYDAIHVRLMAVRFLEYNVGYLNPLLNQLKNGGRLMAPFRDANKGGKPRIVIFDKNRYGTLNKTEEDGVFTYSDIPFDADSDEMKGLY